METIWIMTELMVRIIIERAIRCTSRMNGYSLDRRERRLALWYRVPNRLKGMSCLKVFLEKQGTSSVSNSGMAIMALKAVNSSSSPS